MKVPYVSFTVKSMSMNKQVIEGSSVLTLPKHAPIINKWIITIDDAEYVEGTPEYWGAIRNKEEKG